MRSSEHKRTLKENKSILSWDKDNHVSICFIGFVSIIWEKHILPHFCYKTLGENIIDMMLSFYAQNILANVTWCYVSVVSNFFKLILALIWKLSIFVFVPI